MAEYLPLLERAVAGLADSTPETRRAIYERARAALLAQLRRMDPPIPEADIARESAALDDAVTRIEGRLRRAAILAKPLSSDPAGGTPRPSLRPPRPPPFTPRGASPPGEAPPSASAVLSEPAATVAPAPAPAMAAPPPTRERPVLGPRAADGRPAPRPLAPRAPTTEAAETPKPAPLRPQVSARPLNTAPRASLETRAASLPRQAPPMVPPLEEVPPPLPDPPRAEAASPLVAPIASSGTGPVAVPQSRPRRGRVAVAALGTLLLAALVGGVAFEAWTLRDRPEQIMAAQRGLDQDPNGKVIERAEAQDEPSDAGQPAEPSPAPVVADAPPPAAPATPDAPPPRPSSPATASPAPAPAAPTVPEAQPRAEAPSFTAPLGVAERAALLVVAPDDPQRVKTYAGSVVWKSESVNSGQGQPLSSAILADVRIPALKLTLSMVMQRNLEPQLLASHTIELRFVQDGGADPVAVKQIDVPQMRLDDSSPNGDPLTGLSVAITDNSFLVGLSRGKAEAGNILMLQRRNWFDVPMLLASGKAAKITFEKGTPGQRIIDQAIRNWQSGG